MRILSITAGAAGMYCGSCLGDNALARELMAQGHQVTLLPLYTPTRTDEPNVSYPRVFFGGISVYLEQRLPYFRKAHRILDRLWDSPRLLRALSGGWVRTDPGLLGALTVSVLRGEDGFQRKEFLKFIEWLSHEETPDVVSLPNSLLIGLAAPIRKALSRPVVCMLQGEDLFLDGLQKPYKEQAMTLIRAGFDSVDAIVAVSRHHAEFMAEYFGITRERIQAAPLGINLKDFDPTPRPRTGSFTVGYFARVAPEKGLHVLAEVYRKMRRDLGLPVSRLEAAGYIARDHQDYLASIRRKMQDWGLGDEFHYRGVLDRQEKIAFLKNLDVLCVPGTTAEPKGVYLLEAMASGVPVVEPRRGSFIEIIEKTGGGLLVSADDPAALAEGIMSLWRNPTLADELRRKGAEGVREHYSISLTASRMVSIYQSLLAPAAQPATAGELAR